MSIDSFFDIWRYFQLNARAKFQLNVSIEGKLAFAKCEALKQSIHLN